MDYSDFRLIPTIPLLKGGVLNRSERLATAPVIWDAGKGFVAQSPRLGYQNYTKWLKGQIDKTTPWFMFDAGQEKTGPNYSLIKDSHIRGQERWFDPGVRSIDDIFDAFSMDTDMLLINSAGLDSFETLKEAHEVSDSCIPLLLYDGKSVIFYNGLYDLEKTLNEIGAIGFENIVVMNLPALGQKNKPGNPFWRDIHRGETNLIPAGGITEKDLPHLKDWGYREAMRDYMSPPLQSMENNPFPELTPLESRHEFKRPLPHSALECGLP